MTTKKPRPNAKRTVQAEPIPETDFSKGVRGKHYERYRASVVTVHVDAVAEPVVEYDFSKGVVGKYAGRYRQSVAQGKTKRPRKKPA